VEKDKSNGEGGAGDGQRLTVAGTGYDKGLGVHPFSSVRVWLGGKCTSFSAVVGVDDEVGDSGSVVFSVVGDDKSLAKTGTLTGASPGEKLTVDVTGVRWLDLEVTDSGDNAWSDHADWADARITCA
jgi:beta-galactosidase